MQQPSRESSSVSSSDTSLDDFRPAEMRRQSMSAIRCGAAAAVGSCGDASACSVNGGEGGAAEAAAEAAVASRDVRARWARYARSSSAVFRSRLRSCACEGGGVGGVHLGSRGRARRLCLPGWWPPGRRSDRSRRSPVYRRRSPRPLEVRLRQYSIFVEIAQRGCSLFTPCTRDLKQARANSRADHSRAAVNSGLATRHSAYPGLHRA